QQEEGTERVGERRPPAHGPLHVVRQREHPRADGGVDADAQDVEQREPSERLHALAARPFSALRYVAESKPTSSVPPLRTVGARRFPVGPMRSFVSSSSVGGAFFMSTWTTFLPLATNRSVAAFASSSASAGPRRCFFASTSSTTETFSCARNSCARP